VPANPDEPDRVRASVEGSTLKSEYPGLFADLASYLYEYDPMGLNYGMNADEYEPEVGTILPRLFESTSAAEIAPVIRDEFERWFGSGLRIENATYDELAEGVLQILNRYRC
jgi:hypothetical protein